MECDQEMDTLDNSRSWIGHRSVNFRSRQLVILSSGDDYSGNPSVVNLLLCQNNDANARFLRESRIEGETSREMKSSCFDHEKHEAYRLSLLDHRNLQEDERNAIESWMNRVRFSAVRKVDRQDLRWSFERVLSYG